MSEPVKYRVLNPVTFDAGATLGLTEAQAKARRSGLRAGSKGLHQVIEPVQFKAGEEIVVAGDVPKGLIASLLALSTGGRAALKLGA